MILIKKQSEKEIKIQKPKNFGENMSKKNPIKKGMVKERFFSKSKKRKIKAENIRGKLKN